MIRVTLLLAALFGAVAILSVDDASAQSAPYCVATGYGQNCNYFTRESCEQAAARNRGACVLNSQEMNRRQNQPYSSPSSQAPFCVVTSHSNNCWYHSADACQAAAQRARGTCVYNR